MNQKNNKLEIPVYSSLLIACIAFMYATFVIKKGRAATIGDAFVPRIVIGLLIVLLAILLAQAIRNRVRESRAEISPEVKAEQRAKTGKAIGSFLFVSAVMALSVYMMKSLGFVIAMTFYLLCLFIGLTKKEERNWKVILPIGLLFPVVLFILYLRVFSILLPAGVLKFLT